MKKILSLIASLVLILGCFASVASAADNGITPYLNNVSRTYSDFYIDDNGKATVTVSYTGYAGVTTGATITTKLQKRFLLFFWNDVDIGTANNEWVDETTATNYSNSHSINVSSGTYRVQIEYVIRGTGGTNDTVNTEIEAEY